MAPEGESWAGFFVRVGEALLRAAADHAGETVVVVCHGGVIEGAFAALGGLPLRRPFDVRVENTSLTAGRTTRPRATSATPATAWPAGGSTGSTTRPTSLGWTDVEPKARFYLCGFAGWAALD